MAVHTRNAVLDIGNTSCKVGIFADQELERVEVFEQLSELTRFLQKQSFSATIISNVGKNPRFLDQFPSFEHAVYLDQSTKIPLKNRYKTPETLGADRLAVAVGANQLFPGSNCLVIDMGTCITYELVTQTGEYLGGNILPGLNLRFRAMHDYTVNLPLIESTAITAFPDLVGNTTQSCMLAGVLHGIAAEINGMIVQYQAKVGEIKVLTCGGDAKLFETHINHPIFAVQNLALIGLNSILTNYAH